MSSERGGGRDVSGEDEARVHPDANAAPRETGGSREANDFSLERDLSGLDPLSDTPSRRARWHDALVVVLLLSVLGILLGVPALFVLAVVPLGFVLLGQSSTKPPSDLRIERELEERRLRPGESVTVTVSVTNEGDSVLPDVRVVDDPPQSTALVAGSPAFATALRPGETVTHEYSLRPPRGEFAFGTAAVRLRSLSGTRIRTADREPEGTDSFNCETVLDSFPLVDETIRFVGRTPTDEGGTGLEFFATREYRRGDPINRIDWHRLARTGELATVEYRRERANTTVFVVDDRSGVHRSPPGNGPDTYDLTLYAASRGVVASLSEGDRTGLAMLADDSWIEPSANGSVRERVDDAIGSAAARSGHPAADGGTSFVAELENRLTPRAQVVFCTPLSDTGAVEFVRSLRSCGRSVTVVSPDITSVIDTPPASEGTRIARLERACRIDSCRELGATVVDWQLAEPLSIEFANVIRRGRGPR